MGHQNLYWGTITEGIHLMPPQRTKILIVLGNDRKGYEGVWQLEIMIP